ncbi:MAG TPA: hypothetical protein DEG28_13225 [Porphyromonadaceae bacterium]|jgi:glycosyltransferase involved in cell wall biosynthesis|nr:hypothetical protein [Porphyromonadaceae bacterium]
MDSTLKINQKVVSVIIPFYNQVDWLCDAVQSVLDQTYDNFEIIVVNDGSKEDVNDFIKKYGDEIKYYYKDNGGAASARNLALKYATGDYIAFLDSDDIWLPTKTIKQISFMEENGIMWSHTGYYNWYPEKNISIKKSNGKDFGKVYIQSFLSLKAPTPAIIISKECFDKHPEFYFFEDMKNAQDSALWSRISYYYPLGLINEPLIKIRQRGTNSDLSSLIRFRSKSIIYSKMRRLFYKEIPSEVFYIYKIYFYGNNILEYLQNKLSIKKNVLEFIGKLFWIAPFLLERVYLMLLRQKTRQDPNYIKYKK